MDDRTAAILLREAELPVNEITLRRVLAVFGRRWRVLAFGALVGIIVAIAALFIVTPTYTVTMTVVPAHMAQGNGGLASLARTSELAQLLPTSARTLDSPFSRYQTALTTVALAQRLATRHDVMRTIYKKLWNPETRSFRPIRSNPVTAFFGALIGMQTSAVPSAETLAGFLNHNLTIERGTNDQTLKLSFKWPDPVFAKALLLAIHEEANEMLREKAAARASLMIGYLRERLASVTNQDSRAVLTRLLSDAEQTLLLSQPGVPYAADVIDPPAASDLPTSPKPVLYLLVGFLIGVLIAMVVVIVADALALVPRRRHDRPVLDERARDDEQWLERPKPSA